MTRILKMRDTHISLAHGNGGRMMRELIEELFVPALANPQLDTGADAVSLPIPADRELVVTTPEPNMILLLAAGLAGVGILTRRKLSNPVLNRNLV